MESKAKLFGHPIHQMLIVFPLGLLATSLAFDVAFLATGDSTFGLVSFWMIAAGVCGALAAAVFGLIDWWSIPSGTRANELGLWHGGGNVLVTALFAASWSLRQDAPAIPSQAAIGLSVIGVLLALVTGWLGGELVTRLGVGVDEGAHLNAPTSLSDHPAHGQHTPGAPGTAGPRPI